jgi:hypothetical protein
MAQKYYIAIPRSFRGLFSTYNYNVTIRGLRAIQENNIPNLIGCSKQKEFNQFACTSSAICRGNITAYSYLQQRFSFNPTQLTILRHRQSL